MKRLLVTCVTVAAASLFPILTAQAAPRPAHSGAAAPPTVAGTYVPVTPARIFDSRGDGGALDPGSVRAVQVTGGHGVPDTGVSAVVINLSVNSPQRAGYLSVYPGQTDFTGTSSLSFTAGETRANLVTVPVGTDGTVNVLNGKGASTGPAQVIVDVQGYYLDATSTQTHPSRFFNIRPHRLLDTRTGIGAPLKANGVTYVDVFDYGDVVPIGYRLDSVRALAVNITAVNPSGRGYLVAWDGVADQPPATSNVSYVAGKTTGNNAVVPVAYYPDVYEGLDALEFGIANRRIASTHVVVDVVGVYIDTDEGGLVFRPLAGPVRMVDTRSRTGATIFGPGQTQTITASTDIGSAESLVGNLTVLKPTTATYLTVWPDYERPLASNVNAPTAQTVANHVYIGLRGSEKSFNVYNAAGRANVIIDITGRFQSPYAPGA